VRFQVLGPVRVVREDRSLELARLKERLVLGLMLTHAGRIVSQDRLVDAVWSRKPPANPAATLHVHICHLRSVLEPGRPARAPAQILLRRQDGYLLAVTPGQIDAHVFETAIRQGFRAMAASRPAAAAGILAGALALWRGDPYDGLSGHAFALAEIIRLEELRLLALESLAEADLALGRHASALPGLVQLVALHPLRERLRVLEMTALYRAGRQSDALLSYQNGRALLAGELGVDPGPGLRRCHAQVLAHDPLLDDPATLSTRPAGRALSGLPGLPADLSRV
jgi:DNA-binding SARP family transcriptional activator